MSDTFWQEFPQKAYIAAARTKVSSLIWVSSSLEVIDDRITVEEIEQLISESGETFDSANYEDSAAGKLLFIADKKIITLVPANELELRQVVNSLSEDIEELTETVTALTARLEAMEGG